MKKTILLGIGLLLASQTFGQLPEKGTKAFTFSLSGLSRPTIGATTSPIGTLMFKYYTKPTMAIRASLLATVQNQNTPSAIGISRVTNSNQNNGGGLGIGLQKSLKNWERLEIYVAGDIYGMFSLGGRKTTTEMGDSILSNGTPYNYKLTREVETKSTRNVNVYALGSIGFNYYLKSFLAIGTEFRYGLLYNRYNPGNITTTDYNFAGDKKTVTVNNKASTFLNLGGMSYGNINVSIMF